MLTFDQLCRGLEVEVSAFAICEVRQDATFVLAEDTDTAVHYVLAGEGVAWRATGEASKLSPHTVMIVPPGSRVTVTSGSERRFNLAEMNCEPLAGGWNLLTVGEASPGLTLACGYVQAHYMQVVELFDYLRQPVIQSVAEDRSFRFEQPEGDSQWQPEPLDRESEASHLAIRLGDFGGARFDQQFVVARLGLRDLA